MNTTRSMTNATSGKVNLINRLINRIRNISNSHTYINQPNGDLSQSSLSDESNAYMAIMSPPYGIVSRSDWNMVQEIERRRSQGVELDGLAWPESEDPLSPANDPRHPYHLPR